MSTYISKAALKRWIPFVILATIFSGLAYLMVQQIYRQSANDPLIEITENYAGFLEAGTPVPDTTNAPKADLRKSLSTYIAFFDDKAVLTGSTMILGDQSPVPPAGVFETARAKGEVRFTWQPEKGVQSAVVLRHYNGEKPGFVLAGRSLREIEIRESQALSASIGAWVLSLALTLAVVAFL